MLTFESNIYDAAIMDSLLIVSNKNMPVLRCLPSLDYTTLKKIVWNKEQSFMIVNPILSYFWLLSKLPKP